MKRILVVEDERTIRDFIVVNLQRGGYEVVEADNGEVAIEIYNSSEVDFDVVLLDLMMPKVGGLEVCRHIRKLNQSVGIIILTAKTQEKDKIEGLVTGADDYITKPFSTTELMARVDAVYRRVKIAKTSDVTAQNPSLLISGQFVLNIRNRTLEKNGSLIELTQVEFQILEYFFKNLGAALSRTSILTTVWGHEYIGEEKIVDVNIRRLRMKVETESSNPKCLVTIWGIGYKWIGQ
jgi:DNA-binding response OmpR family regulator